MGLFAAGGSLDLASLLGLSTPQARLTVIPAGLGALALIGPRRLGRLPSVCLVRRLVGRCPACGVTRAMASLLRLDLSHRPRRGLAVLVMGALVGVVVQDVRHIEDRRGVRRAVRPSQVGAGRSSSSRKARSAAVIMRTARAYSTSRARRPEARFSLSPWRP